MADGPDPGRWKGILRQAWPLLLLALVWIPLDMATAVLWGPAIILGLLSLAQLVVRLVKLAFVKDGERRYWLKAGLIRPLLVVATLAIAVTLQVLSRDAADEYAIALARRVHAECRTRGACAPTIREWGGANTTRLGRYGRTYPVSYRVSPDGTTFGIKVSHDIDDSLIIEGGVGRGLRASWEDGQGPYREQVLDSTADNPRKTPRGERSDAAITGSPDTPHA